MKISCLKKNNKNIKEKRREPVMRHLSMEEFKLELEQLSSKGMKFDVKSQGSGNIYLSICGDRKSVV